ncbi:hypothetical protein HHL17_09180 [Chitinophaga sp. G-6-1-13]|uniref:Uncharacterized protein n=1 Tax=Chitinophaga fulva TaxID=2728842 RepID=A0A848GHS1_9BACT|nr:hypothetical protein [Chitinophaga fulva]NML37367.1 hypothetical protein [Chitinophaga fulva]
MTVLRYLPVLGLGLLFSVRTAAQQMKLGLQPTLLKKEALLELNSDSQGLLLNRVPKSAISTGGALFSATDGMFVYVTDPGEKCLYIKTNGAWKKLADFSSITTDNITEGATNLYFTQARARAAFSAGNGININAATGVISNTGVLTFNTRIPDATGNIAPAAGDYASFYLPNASQLTLTAGTGMKATTTATKNLNTNPSFTIDADNGSAIWNANKLSSVPVATTAPALNQVLTFNGTQWEPKAPTGATGNFINNGTALQTAANFNIDGYGDIGRDVRVGGGVVAATATLASKLTLNSLTAGSVPFIDATKAVAENNGQFFWDNTKTALGLGTAAPKNKLEITGQAAGLGETVFTSGLRLSNLATVTPGAPNSKVLTLNNNGDVIVTLNPLANNWLVTGNTGIAAGSFLGTNDDRAMVIKSNATSFLEFGRRQTVGLVDSKYTDPDQPITYVRSAMQFEAPGASFYKPIFYVDADGNFRMKGSSAGTDLFEFGATGSANNGGFDFIVGDDGDEPFVFKSWYHATNTYTELIRIDRNGLGINTNGSAPAAKLDVRGTFKLGTNGSTLNNIIETQVNITSGNINNNASRIVSNIPLSGVKVGDTVILSPVADLSLGLVISWVRVSATNYINVAFANIGGGNGLNPSGTYNVVIIQ